MNYIQMWLFMTNKSEPLRQTSLLMLLAGGIGHGETLIHGLRAHSLESSGVWASKVGQLRVLMEQGHSLSASLAMVRDLLPDQTVSAIRTAENTGTLPDVLVDEAKRISQSIQTSNRSGISLETLAILTCAVGTVAFCVVSFIMLFIIPKFKEIFYGFGVELPGPTILLITISDWCFSYWYLFLLPTSAGLFFSAYWFYTSSVQKCTNGYHRLLEYWPRYWVPGLLRQLSLSAATGQPLSAALDCAMMDIPPGSAARRVADLRNRVTNGQDTVEALLDTNLLGYREAAFLKSSLKTRHLDWGFRHLAESIDRGRARWLSRLPTILAPLVILSMGFVVMFVVVSLFVPLVKMLNDLS